MNKLEELISRLRRNVDYEVKNTSDIDMDYASFQYQAGVLLTPNEAKMIIDALEVAPPIPPSTFAPEPTAVGA